MNSKLIRVNFSSKSSITLGLSLQGNRDISKRETKAGIVVHFPMKEKPSRPDQESILMATLSGPLCFVEHSSRPQVAILCAVEPKITILCAWKCKSSWGGQMTVENLIDTQGHHLVCHGAFSVVESKWQVCGPVRWDVSLFVFRLCLVGHAVLLR